MSNVGKFIDRSPATRAAGVPINILATSGDSLRYHHIEEAAENFIRGECTAQERLIRQRPTQRSPKLETESMKDLMTVELQKSRFVAFREKFQEDMYFKRAEVGKAYPMHTKPDNVNNETTTFGEKIERSEGVYDLILPPKSSSDVNRDFLDFHDKYLISHKHYLPAERINRGYASPPFDCRAKFGYSKPIDWTGLNMKRCLETCDRLLVITKAQHGFHERSMGCVGRSNFRKTYKVPDIRFGKPSNETSCNVRALLENIESCVMEKTMLQALSHINSVRRAIFQSREYYINDLKLALQAQDTENTGFLSLKKALETLQIEHIRVNDYKFRNVLRYFNLIVDECSPDEKINIERFWQLLNQKCPMPRPAVGLTVPANIDNKITTYRLLCKDLEKELPDDPYARRAEALCGVEPKEEPTTAKDVVSPTIPLKCGLRQSDFEKPRTKEELRNIFKRILSEDFDEIWTLACAKRTVDDSLLSVNELRETLDDERDKAAKERERLVLEI